MPIRGYMTHRCVLERNTRPTDSWGNLGPAAWEVLDANLPCFFWSEKGRLDVELYRMAEMHDVLVLVPRSTDIKSGDRINGFYNRRGEAIDPRVMRVQKVAPRLKWISVQADVVA
jgi:hypothetical protein